MWNGWNAKQYQPGQYANGQYAKLTIRQESTPNGQYANGHYANTLPTGNTSNKQCATKSRESESVRSVRKLHGVFRHFSPRKLFSHHSRPLFVHMHPETFQAGRIGLEWVAGFYQSHTVPATAGKIRTARKERVTNAKSSYLCR